ncbi:MAG TPA: DMT family transporter [Gammaproteobacteria bacterium]|nr:DMT family transporter [Gammaproteobacteria bacterium]
MPVNDHVRGASCLVAAALLFACMAALIKTVAAMHVPNHTIVFFRNLFGLAAMLPWLARRGVPALGTAYPFLHLARGIAGLVSMYCFFFAIAHMHLADVMVLNYTSPLFLPLLALLWLGEPVTPRLWFALGLGFMGVLLILKPGMSIFSPAALIGLASGLFAAVTIVVIRRMAGDEPSTRIVFYYSAIGTLGSGLALAWGWQAPSPVQLMLLLLTGLCATGGQLFLTHGYTLAAAARIGPFMYTAVIFAAALGWLLWHEVPGGLSLAGAALICIAGILAVRHMGAPLSPQAPR